MNAEPKVRPQKISAPLSPGGFAAVLLGATALGVGALVFFFNPSTHGFYPICLFHAVTGLNCPGCGMTRALYALLHGNFLQALQDNALFVAILAVSAVWSARCGVRKMQGHPVTLKISPKILWWFFVLTLLFGVARNLPGFEWLSP
jgi:hypothetical protein